MPALALAQVIIPLLPIIAGDVTHLVDWIKGVRGAAMQSGEWTAAIEGAFRQSLINSGEDPAYHLDPK